MNNEEFQETMLQALQGFQNVVLQELTEFRQELTEFRQELTGFRQELTGFEKTMLQELKTLRTDVNELKADVNELKADVNEIKIEQKSMSSRQDEMYQVVRAIEHSNLVGKSELDSQNIRLAKVEGKIKRVGKAYNEEFEVDKASNL